MSIFSTFTTRTPCPFPRVPHSLSPTIKNNIRIVVLNSRNRYVIGDLFKFCIKISLVILCCSDVPQPYSMWFSCEICRFPLSLTWYSWHEINYVDKRCPHTQLLRLCYVDTTLTCYLPPTSLGLKVITLECLFVLLFQSYTTF